MAQHYRPQLESQFLSGTLFFPSTRAATARITPDDLSRDNATVLRAFDAVVEDCRRNGTRYSEFLVIDRLTSLGLKIGGVLEAGVYIQSLKGLSVGEDAVEGIAKQLYQVTVRRELNSIGRQIVQITDKEEALKAGELVAKVTEAFNGKVNILAGSKDEEPQDLFGTVGGFLDSETAFDTRSILTPYPTYNDLYGSWDPGSLYFFASRMKVGKSTLWLSTLQQLAKQDTTDSFRALVLDTELTAEENQSRALSAVSGVKEYFIRHKLYRKDATMRAKVEKAKAFLEPLAGRVAHKYVGGMDLTPMLTLARRWASKTLKEGKRGLIVLDYVKLNSSLDFQTKARDITFGAKVDAFKNLGKELNVPVVGFVQTNRENEDSKSGGKLINSSVIAGGDMLAQFASVVMVLDKLSPEERLRLCPDDSVAFTHRLLPIATRQLGPDNLGKNRLVYYDEMHPVTKRVQKRTTENHILLNFDSFRVSEASTPTFYDLMRRQQVKGIAVQPAPEAEASGDRPLL